MRTDASSNSYRRAIAVGQPLPAAPARVASSGSPARRLHRQQDALTAASSSVSACRGGRGCSRMYNATGVPRRLSAAGAGRRSLAVGELEPDYISTLLAQTHSIADPRQAAAAGRRHQPAADAAAPRPAARDRVCGRRASQAREPAPASPRCSTTPELVDLVTGAPPTQHWRRQLDRTCRRSPAAGRSGEFLEGATSFRRPPSSALGEFRASLAHLQALDSEALQHLMQGTLDLVGRIGSTPGSPRSRPSGWPACERRGRKASVRRRLRVGRESQARRPRRAARRRHAAAGRSTGRCSAGQRQRLHSRAVDDARRDRGAAAQRPSRTHPACRSRDRTVRDRPVVAPRARGVVAARRRAPGPAARRAARLPLRAPAARAGKGPVHRAFRELAPLAAGKLQTSDAAARNHCRQQRRRRPGPAPEVERPGEEVRGEPRLRGTRRATPADMAVLEVELNALGDSIDALSDALTAEAAYQMVRGNVSRTASTLNAIATGDAPAPELEVARRRAPASRLTHRLLLLFSGKATSGNSVRAGAEPLLNAWAARVLGDPRIVRCAVERLDDATGRSRKRARSSSASAGSCLSTSFTAWTSSRRAGELSEIEQLVLYHARHKPAASRSMRACVSSTRGPPIWAPTAAHAAGHHGAGTAPCAAAVTGARGADPEDLTPPERAASGDHRSRRARTPRRQSRKPLRAAHKAT